MAERYQRCFTLPVNLYAPGAPVLIAAGALLLDTQTNSMLAQLKLQNIGATPIKSVKVAVSPLDPAGRALGEPVPYQYLDLSVARDEMFGQKYPIHLPDASSRSFTAAVTEVIFSDNTIWSADAAAAWAPLAEPKPLRDALGDMELVKQYELRHGADAAVLPVRIGDLWRCACGALNRGEEAVCHVCSKQAEALFAPELMQELEREKDARLEQERIEREAKEAAEREAAEKRKAAAEAAAKKTKKILKIVLPVLVVVIAAALVVTKVVIPTSRYNKAVKLMEAGKYDEAITMFEALDGYKDSDEKIPEAQNLKEEAAAKAAAEQATAEAKAAIAEAEALEKDGKTAEAAMAYGALIDVAPECRERSFALWNEIAQRQTISSMFGTVGLQSDGTAIAIGKNNFGKHDVSDWTNIVAVSAGNAHTVGLRDDGTVVAVGSNDYGQCNVSRWSDIVAVSAGCWHTVGIRADGTVVAVGTNDYGQCNVSRWSDIVAVSGGWCHTVGLRANGTVVATGNNDYGQCDVSGWTGIVAVSAGRFHTVGLRADGTVVAVGNNDYGQCDVSGWTDIVAVSAGQVYTVGLRADGTVVAVGSNGYGQCNVSSWSDIVAISAGGVHTVGLRADGTVVAIGDTEDSRCDVSDWTDMKLPSNKK